MVSFSSTSDHYSDSTDNSRQSGQSKGYTEGCGETKGDAIIVIDRRAFSRECVAGALRAANPDIMTLAYSSVQHWLQDEPNGLAASLILLSTGGRRARDEDIGQDIALIAQSSSVAPVALLSDEEDPAQVIAALDKGVRGYISTSLPLNVAIEALQLVRAGGTYIPASSLLSYRRTLETSPHATQDTGVFTVRQTAVLRALREGKANKLIAYELNMRESTVKVHVRNIMKKLKARNRTEVAFKTSELFPGSARY